MLNIENVFSFSEGDIRNSIRVELSDKSLSKDLLFSNKEDMNIIEFHYLKGSKLYDILPTAMAGIYLVSTKVKNLLSKNGFTGYALRSTLIKCKNNQFIKDYYLLSITSKVGPIINKKSEKKRMPPLVPWGEEYFASIGLYFEIDTWDKSDLFYSEGTYYIFVVEEVKNKFEKENISNCSFKRIVDMVNFNC